MKPYINQQQNMKRRSKIVDFSIKLKEREKKDKYLDFA